MAHLASALVLTLTLMPATALASPGPKVDNGDGTYHYALPTGASTADEVGPIFTWQYQGQANFPWTPPTPVPPTDNDDDPDTGDYPNEGLGNLEGTIMVDDLGRKWTAASIDLAAANYAVADYWADVDANYGMVPDPTGSAPSQDLDALDTATGTLWFRSWSERDCTGNGVFSDIALWNTESRTTFNSGTATSPLRESLVSVSGGCSGVRLASDVVLTAAHCVTNPATGRPLPVNNMDVCSSTASTSDCSDVSRVVVPAAWPGSDNASTSQIRNDVAILRLTNSPDALGDPIAVFTSDSRNEVKKRNPTRVGFDSFILNGSGICSSVVGPSAVEHPPTAVRGTRGGLLRFRADDAPGGSGGPWAFTHLGVPRVVGVHSVYHQGLAGTGFVGGPRVNDFRNWAIGVFGNR